MAEFEAIFSRTPRLTVEILLEIDGKLVLIERQESSWHGQWHLPGGSVFYREKITDTIQRIGFEELGIAIEPVKMLWPVEYWDEIKERGFGFAVGIGYICKSLELITPEIISEWKEQHIEVFSQIPANTIREQIPLINQVLPS